MDHKIIKYMAVVDYGSFTAGAERLRVSQPSLSVAIKKLEKELGVQLILRGGNFFQVTEAGKLVYEYSTQARLQFKNLKAELEADSKSQRLLRAGMLDSVADRLFSSSVDVSGQLEARIDNSTRLLRAIRLDQLDIAFITSPLGSISDTYRVLTVGEERFVAVCAPDLAVSVQKKLKKNQTIDNLLTYDQSSTTFQWINRYFTENNITYMPKFFSTNPELMRRMALAGKGLALLPSSLVAEELKAKKLIHIEGIDFKRTIIGVTLSEKYISEEMKQLIATTTDCLRSCSD